MAGPERREDGGNEGQEGAEAAGELERARASDPGLSCFGLQLGQRRVRKSRGAKKKGGDEQDEEQRRQRSCERYEEHDSGQRATRLGSSCDAPGRRPPLMHGDVAG